MPPKRPRSSRVKVANLAQILHQAALTPPTHTPTPTSAPVSQTNATPNPNTSAPIPHTQPEVEIAATTFSQPREATDNIETSSHHHAPRDRVKNKDWTIDIIGN